MHLHFYMSYMPFKSIAERYFDTVSSNQPPIYKTIYALLREYLRLLHPLLD